MSNKTKTHADLISGKLGAIMNALKKSGAYLDPDTLDAMKEAITKTINVGRHYNVEVTHDPERVNERLTLRHTEHIYSDRTEIDIESGKAMFGEMRFGRHVLMRIDDETTPRDNAGASELSLPEFNAQKPLVMIIARRKYTICCDDADKDDCQTNFDFVIYVPCTYPKVDAVLGEEKCSLPEDAVRALENALVLNRIYKREVIHSAELARNRLMLRDCTMTDCPGCTQVDHEKGKVVYGDVEFGVNRYGVSLSDEEEFGDSDRREYSEEPKFNAAKPFVVLITNKRTTYRSTGDEVEHTHYIVVYDPYTKST